MTKLSADAVVIGGGAAGMMCSLIAARRGLDVILLEPNKMLGRKLRITGKGRCNVTNNCDIKEFLTNIPGDGRFLYSALNRLSPRDTMQFFESLGLPLKTERGNRVFPVSDNANDVAGTLARNLERSGVRHIRESANHIIAENGEVTGVKTDSGDISCRAAVICTGGLSYPLTGSTGAGYKMARELGHSIVPCRPSLVPLESDDEYCAQMQGFSLKNVTLSAYENDKLIFRELGEMLFTHFGVSGPMVLSASAHMRHMVPGRYTLWIDWKPGLTPEQLDNRVLRDLQAYKNADVANTLGKLLPRTAIPVVLRLAAIAGDTKGHSITREERNRLVSLLKAFPVSIRGFRPVEEAIITSGGVSVKEVQAKTMESKLVSGLYFAGEVLDVDAYTGGFNLQIAFSTGMALGHHI